jgi:hypothetical protein
MMYDGQEYLDPAAASQAKAIVNARANDGRIARVLAAGKGYTAP